MFRWKKRGNTPKDSLSDPKNSAEAMVLEASRQGWLADRNLGFIPELMNIYINASDSFSKLIDESEPRMRETLVFHACRYLFAKAVEGVILWGKSPDGKISVYFHPKHLVGEIETEVPRHLHEVVTKSMAVGESLFKAHQDFIIRCQKQGAKLDLQFEINETLKWISRLGISYALFHKYHTLS